MKKTLLFVLSVLFVLTAQAGSPKKLYVYSYKNTVTYQHNRVISTEVLSHLRGDKYYFTYDKGQNVYHRTNENGENMGDDQLVYDRKNRYYVGDFMDWWFMVIDSVYLLSESELVVVPITESDEDDDPIVEHNYYLSSTRTVY